MTPTEPIGVYFLADDAALQWATVLLESLRASDPDVTVWCIPYSVRTDRLARLGSRYGFDLLEDPSLDALDDISRRLDPTRVNPMFRKWAAFWGPLTHFLYVDADVAIFEAATTLATLPSRTGHDLLFGEADIEQAYLPGEFRDEMIRLYRSPGINAGVWASRARLFTLDRVDRYATAALPHVSSFHPSNLDQAFLNYCLDRSGARITSFQRATANQLLSMWAGNPELADAAPLAYGANSNLRFALVHWAGYRFEPGIPHYDVVRHFRQRAIARDASETSAGHP